MQCPDSAFMHLSLFCPTGGGGGGADLGEIDILNCLKSKSPPLSLLVWCITSRDVKTGQSLCTGDPDSISLSNSRLSGMVFCLKPVYARHSPGRAKY